MKRNNLTLAGLVLVALFFSVLSRYLRVWGIESINVTYFSKDLLIALVLVICTSIRLERRNTPFYIALVILFSDLFLEIALRSQAISSWIFSLVKLESLNFLPQPQMVAIVLLGLGIYLNSKSKLTLGFLVYSIGAAVFMYDGRG